MKIPMKKRMEGGLPHLSMIIALMLLTFFTADRFNTAMAFINHPMTKRLLTIWLILSAACLGLLLKRAAGKPTRLFFCLFTALTEAALAVLLLIDLIKPAWLLFTHDSVKFLIAAAAVCALCCNVRLIILQRKEAKALLRQTVDQPCAKT